MDTNRRLPTTFSSILLAATLLAGCYPEEQKLHCPAFDQSVIQDWAPNTIHSTVLFSDESGGQRTYTLERIEDITDPEQYVPKDDPDPFCRAKIKHLYVANDKSHAFVLEFSSLKGANGHGRAEPTTVSISPMEPVGGVGYHFYVRLRDMENDNNDSSSEVVKTYAESQQVGQSTYNDVVSVIRVDPNQPPYTLPADKQFRVMRIVFAREAGLVGMELENGQFFTLMH